MSDSASSLFWFRQDLRLADNPALASAVSRGCPLVLLYVLDEETPGEHAVGGAQRWWLHHSLAALAAEIERLGGRLTLRRGSAAEVLEAVVRESGADAVFWNRCYEPFAVERDRRLKERLKADDIAVESDNAALLVEPWRLKTGAGEPYKVYSPFWRALREAYNEPAPLPPPQSLPKSPKVKSDRLEAWGLLPTKPDWAAGFGEWWEPGEAGAQTRLADFLDQGVESYKADRDRPDRLGTSRLSPHLHLGELGPRQVWHATRLAAEAAGGKQGAEKFLSELAWREFSHHLLFHYPDLPEKNWRSQFDAFPWRSDEKAFRAWTAGRTGYPIVDAGMRELWQSGWMHNRVRMVVASFLIKHLLIDWRKGAAWFWDTLVDADLANNAASWQWVAGSGADAAPYFRVFNPILQGERFDPEGHYVRRWVPELAKLPANHIHQPWEAPAEVLEAAGVTLGKDYPHPLVEHGAARRRALAAFEEIKKDAAE